MTPTFGKARFGATNGIAPLSTGIPPAMYPAAIATNARLTIAVDRLQTRLAVPLAATDTTMTVLDGTGIAVSSLLSIDNEIVQVQSGSGNTWQISRGFDGTVGALHLGSALVSGFIDAWHHNALVSEVKAIETFLGPNGNNLAGSVTHPPIPFTAQAPGGSLVVGNNSITLTPVPMGVNGTDLKHYLYVSGGTGTAEAVLITGGTAVAGAASGTLIIQCANTHSGAWTIQTATGGIQEAIVQYPGSHIVIPSGRIDTYAPVFLDIRQSGWISGSGMSADSLSGTYLQMQHAGNGFNVAPGAGSSNSDNRVVIEQLMIRGTDAPQAAQIGVFGSLANGLALRDLDISTMGGTGIMLDACYSSKVENVIVTHCHLEGLTCRNGTGNVTVRDSMIASNSRLTDSRSNIRLDTANNIYLLRVDLSYAGTDGPNAGCNGIFTLNCHGVTLRDCYAEYSSGLIGYFGPGTLGVLLDGTYLQDGIVEFDAASNYITMAQTRLASFLSKPTGYIFHQTAPAKVLILNDVSVTAGPFTKTLGATGATVLPT